MAFRLCRPLLAQKDEVKFRTFPFRNSNDDLQNCRMKTVIDASPVSDLSQADSHSTPSPAIWPWLLAGVMLAAVFLAANFPLVNGKQAAIWDAESFFAPAFTLIADHARAGRIVLWNPWESGGSPDYAEPELGTVSPIEVSIGVLAGGTEAGFRAYYLLFWLCGGIGMLLLARQLRASAWMGFVVALAFVFCGFYTSHAEHTSSIYSFSFLPWIVWRFDVAVTAKRLMAAAQAGALWGLSALGGYPQLTILTGGFVLLWAIGRWYFSSTSDLEASAKENIPLRIRFKIQVFVLFFVIGTAVLAPSYIAFFLEGGTGYSDRVGPRSRAESVSSNLIEPGALTTFSSPYLTDLKFFNPRLWPHSDTSLTNIYLGGLITVLAFLSVVSKIRSKWRWWILCVAAFFLACSVGRYLPLRGWLYDYCIPTRYFRNPALFRAYPMFLASVLALLTMRDLNEHRKSNSSTIWLKLLAVSAVAALSAYVAYTHVIHSVSNVGPWLHRANKHLAWAWLGCVALSLLLLLIPKSRKLLPIMMIILALADAGQTIRLARMTVSSDGHARHTWTRINAAHNPNLLLTPNGLQRDLRPPAWIGGAKNNENVPMKMVTFLNYATMTNTFQMQLAQDPVLAEMAIAKDRIWFSPVAVTAQPKDVIYSAFTRRRDSLGAPVLVVHTPEQMREIRHHADVMPEDTLGARLVSQLPAAQQIAFNLLRYTPNHFDLQVTAPNDGWVLVTDRWCRGWQAQVNGEDTPVFGGNFIFRSVKVHAGKNLINFAYRPAGWPVLFFLSWGTLFAVLVGPQLSPKRIGEWRSQLVSLGTRPQKFIPTLSRLTKGFLPDIWTRAKHCDVLGNAPSRISWLLGAGVLIAVFASCNFRLITGAETLHWDAAGFFAPAFTLVADHARAGRIMLWNPWISGGSPDYAEPELGAVSPVAVLVGAVTGGTETGFRIYYLLIWLLGPIGMLILARHLRAPPWAGVIVALGLMFCGFYTGHAQHTSSVYSFSWLSLIVWRTDVALVARRFWPAVQAGALWGVSALGGYPELVILTGGLIFFWMIGRFVFESSAEPPKNPTDIKGSRRIKSSKPLFFASAMFVLLLVGVAILTPAYAAFFFEGHGYADRVGIRSRQEATESMAMPAAALTSISSPYVAKLKVFNRHTLWPQTDGSMVSLYLGALVPTFALFALVLRPKSGYRWWLAGVLIFFLACALGSQLPLRGWLYDYVYPTRYFRNPALFREYSMFCAATLALLALSDMGEIGAQCSTKPWKRLAITALLQSAAAIAGYIFIVSRVQNRGDLFFRATWQVVLVWFGLLGIVFTTWLLPTARKTFSLLLLALALTDAVLTVLVMQGGVFPFVSSAGAGRDSWHRINIAHHSNLDLTRNGFQRLLRTEDFSIYPNNKNVPLKFSTFENYETMWNRFELMSWGNPVFLAMSTGPDRIWFSRNVVKVTPTDVFYTEFSKRVGQLNSPILLVHPPETMSEIRDRNLHGLDEAQHIAQIMQSPAAQKLPAKLMRYTPNHLDLEITAPSDGWLLITDRWARGWSAKINGEPGRVFGGDFIFRAVQVRAGLNKIEFSYRPFGFPLLLILSWGTLMGVFGGPQIRAMLRTRRRLARLNRARSAVSIRWNH